MNKQYGIPIYAGSYSIGIPALCPGCRDMIPLPDRRREYLDKREIKKQPRPKESRLLKKF